MSLKPLTRLSRTSVPLVALPKPPAAVALLSSAGAEGLASTPVASPADSPTASPAASPSSATALAAVSSRRKRPAARLRRAACCTVDLSQCHNESLDLMRLIVGLHPEHLTEVRARHFSPSSSSGSAALASLLWTGRAAARTMENFTRLLPGLGRLQGGTGNSSVTNHFPAVDEMCEKGYLARRLAFFSRACPGQFDFTPRTWVLPAEWSTFRDEVVAATAAAAASAAAGASSAPAATPTWIFKPSTGSQGAGIELAQSLSACDRIYRASLESGEELTVQEYIASPQLLGGLKFDFRIYVLLSSLSPLRAHLYPEGLARFCTTPYAAPSKANLSDFYVHLTNSSLNKTNETEWRNPSAAELGARERAALEQSLAGLSKEEYKENSATPPASSPSLSFFPSSPSPPPPSSSALPFALPEDSSKRLISTVLAQLRAQGVDVGDAEFWADVKDIVEKTLVALWAPMQANMMLAFPSLSRAGGGGSSAPPASSPCFHLLGFDIMRDSGGKAWLLELNTSPALGVEGTVDLVLKKALLEKTLQIVGLLPIAGRESRREPREGSIDASPAPSPSLSPSSSVDESEGSPLASPRGTAGSPELLPVLSLRDPTPSPRLDHASILRSSPLASDAPVFSFPPSPLAASASSSSASLPPLLPYSRRSFALTPLAPGVVRFIVAPGGFLRAVGAPPSPPARTESVAAVVSQAVRKDSFESSSSRDCEYVSLFATNSAADSPLPHPLMFFAHPKLLAAFERFTTGPVKKLSSSKFMQLCCGCRVLAAATGPGGASTVAAAATSTVRAAPRPLHHWPTRPDIDLLFLQHTKDSGASLAGSGSGKMLDYSSFCDAMFQIAETKYKPCITAPTANGASPASSTAASTMTLLAAFQHFVNSLVVPEEKLTPKVAAPQLAPSVAAERSPSAFTAVTPTPPKQPASFSFASLPSALGRLTALSRSLAPIAPDVHPSPRGATFALAEHPSPQPRPLSQSPATVTLSTLLAPKDPSARVFNRLTGVAPARASTAKKRRLQREAQVGSYEAFMAAHLARKAREQETRRA